MKTKTSEDGFTLLELMVAVAVFGILSSLAMAEFSGYQARARSAQAKLYLSQAFVAEKGSLAEYGSYSNCLAAQGLSIDSSQSYYAVGFEPKAGYCNNGDNGKAWGAAHGKAVSAAHSQAPCEPLPASVPRCDDDERSTWFGAQLAANSKAKPLRQKDLEGTTLTTTQFTIAATGQVAPSSPTQLDRWTINEARVLRKMF